jgi:hypothetical protein
MNLESFSLGDVYALLMLMVLFLIVYDCDVHDLFCWCY